MSLEEFAIVLEGTGYPVAFWQFPKEAPHDPPFICYITPGSNPFGADGVVYYSSDNIQVELYTLKRDKGAQKKVEAVLASFFYLKDEGYLEDEKMYMTKYTLSL